MGFVPTDQVNDPAAGYLKCDWPNCTAESGAFRLKMSEPLPVGWRHIPRPQSTGEYFCGDHVEAARAQAQTAFGV